MLVLTRKEGESIAIGESITVRVLSIKGDQIQLGIQAPRAVPVHRMEVLDQIRADLEAARVSAGDAEAIRRFLGAKPEEKTP